MFGVADGSRKCGHGAESNKPFSHAPLHFEMLDLWVKWWGDSGVTSMPRTKPNIVLITSDQQRTDTLGCYGARHVRTPNLDRLAAEGILLERAYCTNPVCTPARASLFTGRYVSRHGAWNVGLNVPEDTVMITHRLAAAGYLTHNIGKAHFQSLGGTAEQSLESINGWREHRRLHDGPYYGFQTAEFALGHTTFGLNGHYGAWVVAQTGEEKFKEFRTATRRSRFEFGGEAYDWTLPTRLHNSVWTADRAIAFLERQDGARPFFLAVGFQDPHHPHCLPMDFEARVNPDAVPMPDFTEGELDDKPPHFLEARHGTLEESNMRGAFMVAGQGTGANYTEVSDEDARLGRAYYYGMCQLLDQQLGRVLDCLDRRGLTQETLVIFTSDHGELLGDHGLWMKGPFHYEQLVRVPFIARLPRVIPEGMRTAALFSHVDVTPTLLSAAGLKPAEELDGRDALPLWRGETNQVRDFALVECVDDPKKLRLKSIITKNRKLTWYCEQSYGELYDLDRDPREKQNRWDDPKYASEKAALLSRLLETMEPLERRVSRHSYA